MQYNVSTVTDTTTLYHKKQDCAIPKKKGKRKMTRIHEFRNKEWYTENELLTDVKAMTSEELKKMAKGIFENGTIEKEEICYGTTNLFTVKCDGLPIKYVVKIDCFKVSEIIEIIG